MDYKQKTDKSGRVVTNIQLYVEDYLFLAKQVKYKEKMADAVARVIEYVRKKRSEAQ